MSLTMTIISRLRASQYKVMWQEPWVIVLTFSSYTLVKRDNYTHKSSSGLFHVRPSWRDWNASEWLQEIHLLNNTPNFTFSESMNPFGAFGWVFLSPLLHYCNAFEHTSPRVIIHATKLEWNSYLSRALRDTSGASQQCNCTWQTLYMVVSHARLWTAGLLQCRAIMLKCDAGRCDRISLAHTPTLRAKTLKLSLSVLTRTPGEPPPPNPTDKSFRSLGCYINAISHLCTCPFVPALSRPLSLFFSAFETDLKPSCIWIFCVCLGFSVFA